MKNMEKELFNLLFDTIGEKEKQRDFELTIKELKKLTNKNLKNMSLQELSKLKYLTINLLNHLDK